MKAWIVSLVLVVLTASVQAQAGIEAHGGVSVVCRDSNGEVASAELLDLFEARNQFGLSVTKTAIPRDQQVAQVIPRLSENAGFQEEFRNQLAIVVTHLVVMEREVQINPINDSFPILKKKFCAYEQLAVYTEDGLVLVDSEIYSALSETDRAALLVHEVVYSIARAKANAKDSVDSRKLTAYLFSDSHKPEMIDRFIDLVDPILKPGLYRSGDWCARRVSYTDGQFLKVEIVHDPIDQACEASIGLGSIRLFQCDRKSNRCTGNDDGRGFRVISQTSFLDPGQYDLVPGY